jgi:hypothetical protein
MPLFTTLRNRWEEEKRKTLEWLSRRAARPELEELVADRDLFASFRNRPTIEVFVPIKFTPTMGRLAPSRVFSKITEEARDQVLRATSTWDRPIDIVFRTAWSNLPSLASTVDKALQNRLRGLDFRPNLNQRGLEDDPAPDHDDDDEGEVGY